MASRSILVQRVSPIDLVDSSTGLLVAKGRAIGASLGVSAPRSWENKDIKAIILAQNIELTVQSAKRPGNPPLPHYQKAYPTSIPTPTSPVPPAQPRNPQAKPKQKPKHLPSPKLTCRNPDPAHTPSSLLSYLLSSRRWHVRRYT